MLTLPWRRTPRQWLVLPELWAFLCSSPVIPYLMELEFLLLRLSGMNCCAQFAAKPTRSGPLQESVPNSAQS